MPEAIAILLLQESPVILGFIKGLWDLKKAHPQLTDAQISALTTYAHTMDDGTRAIILADQASH